jgi:hypothetical protein
MSAPTLQQAFAAWPMESCDACHRAFPSSHLMPVILPDSTSELLCAACVDDLRLELLADGGAS